MSLIAIGERAAIRAIRLAPKQLYSTMVDWGARRLIPRTLRSPIYATYSRLVGADLAEVELPLAEYPTFGEFFARRLRAGARDPSTDMTAAASPCDGRVGSLAEIESGSTLQAKGRAYRLADLLADQELAEALEGGNQVTIYLSPADYHRVHAPVSAKLVAYTYVPGARLPVGRFFVDNIDGLFSENERLVLHLESDGTPMAIVLVGAMGVGNLCLANPPIESRSFPRQRACRRVELDPPIAVARGQELGAFHLGSTVVVAFARGFFSPGGLGQGDRVQCGQPIGRLSPRQRWMVE